MFTYGEAREHGDFEYGVVTYLDGDGDAVVTEGYVRPETVTDAGVPVVTVVEPDELQQVPFDRVVTLRYPDEGA